MNKNLLLIGIIFLFFICISIPITIGLLPEKPVITFDQVDYEIGDNVKVTLYSGSNIDGFLVNIQYGRETSVDYVEDFHTKYVTASGNTATISFRASKGDTYVTIEAWAFDAPENQGGIPSEKAMSSIWIKSIKHNSASDFPEDNSTPSFEFIFVISSIFVLFVLKKCSQGR